MAQREMPEVFPSGENGFYRITETPSTHMHMNKQNLWVVRMTQKVIIVTERAVRATIIWHDTKKFETWQSIFMRTNTSPDEKNTHSKYDSSRRWVHRCQECLASSTAHWCISTCTEIAWYVQTNSSKDKKDMSTISEVSLKKNSDTIK